MPIRALAGRRGPAESGRDPGGGNGGTFFLLEPYVAEKGLVDVYSGREVGNKEFTGVVCKSVVDDSVNDLSASMEVLFFDSSFS